MRQSQGSGTISAEAFKAVGEGAVIEPGVLVFHPENIELGKDVYIGHQTILKAYFKELMIIGEGSWIGQQCFLHSAGGIRIGRNVGIGPAVRIITSFHSDEGRQKPILHSTLEFAPVQIEDDTDIGTGAIILPGVHIGQGAQIGAGAVVTADIPAYAVAIGVPARVIRYRKE